MDDQRDYEEEAANRRDMEEEAAGEAEWALAQGVGGYLAAAVAAVGPTTGGTVDDPPVRAHVTLTFALRSAAPLDMPPGDLAAWVADRMGWVTDNGPYEYGTGGARIEIDFGPTSWE